MKIRVLELFGGIGACSKALERLGIDFEIVDYVEIDKFAVASFNAIHGTSFEPQGITEWDKDLKVDLIIGGFPCQDISIAGKQAGIVKGETRSGLMYEMMRIIAKLKPKYVVAENVKNLLSKKHRHNFDAYLAAMDELGYNNYHQVLNAKDYGVPQNRERVFVVSIRKDVNDGRFSFPEPIPLKKKLKDVLEDEVDEKYYLSDVQIGKIKMSTYRQNRTRIQEGDVAQTLCARDWKDPKCIKVGDLDMKGHESMKRVYSADGISPTLTTMGGENTEPKIIDPQGRLNKVNTPKDYAPTLRAQDHGNPPMAIVDDTYAATPYRIRKLTPLSCWRLMGFDDADFEKASKVNSNTQLYKQAGNSIVVNVLEAILKNLLLSS